MTVLRMKLSDPNLGIKPKNFSAKPKDKNWTLASAELTSPKFRLVNNLKNLTVLASSSTLTLSPS